MRGWSGPQPWCLRSSGGNRKEFHVVLSCIFPNSRFSTALPLLAIACIFFVGCAPARFKNGNGHDFSSPPPKVKRIAILPPDMKVHDISAGGIWEYRDDWSMTSRFSAIDAIESVLKEKLFTAVRVSDSMIDSA